MLEFLSGWLAADPACLAASPEQLVGDPAYGLAQLHDDLERFTFCSAAATVSNSSAHTPMCLGAVARGPAGPAW